MRLNPVERRLALLCGDWIDFRSDTSKRLLIWQVPENAMRLVQCFFEAQKHDLEYSSGDVFIVFDAGFEDSLQYSRALKESLRDQYDASREDLQKEALSTDWPFMPADTPDTARGFVHALRSFGSEYRETIQHLVGVLTPTTITDDEMFGGWLLRALDEEFPKQLRLVVLDSVENPRFLNISSVDDSRIDARAPAVDGLATAEETFAQEGATGPAGVFRNYLIGVVSLIEKGTADQVKAKARDAFNFAQAQKWPDQEVALRILIAGAMLKEKRHSEAIGIYRAARTAADEAVAAQHPAGQKLVLQTLFGEAGAHLAAGNDLAAADCYDQAATIAQQDRNAVMAIEACRMGSFCHARAGAKDAALQRSVSALQLGEDLKSDARGMTSLPIAAVDLLRLLDSDRVGLLEECKRTFEQRLADARRQADKQAADLDRNPDRTAATRIRVTLEQESNAARAEANRTLGEIIAAADVSFRNHFAQARFLLGIDWPVFSPVGLFTAAGRTQAEAATS